MKAHNEHVAPPDQGAVDEQSATPTATEAHPKVVRKLGDEEMTRVMVIGVYPDDPEFGVGSTIAGVSNAEG
jgi:hypothetical protein